MVDSHGLTDSFIGKSVIFLFRNTSLPPPAAKLVFLLTMIGLSPILTKFFNVVAMANAWKDMQPKTELYKWSDMAR